MKKLSLVFALCILFIACGKQHKVVTIADYMNQFGDFVEAKCTPMESEPFNSQVIQVLNEQSALCMAGESRPYSDEIWYFGETSAFVTLCEEPLYDDKIIQCRVVLIGTLNYLTKSGNYNTVPVYMKKENFSKIYGTELWPNIQKISPTDSILSEAIDSLSALNIQSFK